MENEQAIYYCKGFGNGANIYLKNQRYWVKMLGSGREQALYYMLLVLRGKPAGGAGGFEG